MIGESKAARPVGIAPPDREYTPPKPGYRRPDSDGLPRLSAVPAATLQASKQEATPLKGRFDFDGADSRDRRRQVLEALADGPLARADLAGKLGAAAAAKALSDLLFNLKKDGLVGRNSDGQWHLQEAVRAPAPVTEKTAKARARKPEAIPPSPTPAPGSGVSQPEAAAPVELVRLQEATRFAITNDGCLLIWLDASRVLEVPRETAHGVKRLLSDNLLRVMA